MRVMTKLLCLGLLPALLGGCTPEELQELLGAEMYFVKLKTEPAKTANVVAGLAEDLNIKPIHVYDSATQGFSVLLVPRLADEVEKIKHVEYIKKDKRQRRTPDEEELPDDDDVVQDPGPVIGDKEIPESIRRIGGPYQGNASFDNCHVAVIDTGIDSYHPDLRVVGEFDAVAKSGGAAAPGADPNGHGTHVAGTIGALPDGEGVVGVAPGVPLHAVRVLDAAGSGYTSDIVAGLEYVMKHPEICVVNMSLGGGGSPTAPNDPMRDAIEQLEAAGVVVVIAAGNSTMDTNGFVPAGYDLGVVVSAYDAAGGSDNGFAWFSNYGAAVDVSAPGVDIMSTWPGGGYSAISGTSMAAPAVAGAAAVFKALEPGAGVNRVRNQLRSTGESGYKGQTGANGQHPEPMVDMPALIQAAGG